jgi:CRISPR/Cas system-associated exonuclease Cas4 (RecB family)
MTEVQAHGFNFEKWVRDHFFAGYTGSYMQKWDVPADQNTQTAVPTRFHRIPVSIKTAKVGSPIGLGDALRQRQIDHAFLMIVGFWEQRGPSEKWLIDIGCALFLASDWEALWGQLTLAEIKVIDKIVKNQKTPYSIVRTEAKAWKKRASVKTASLVINPKIDSKKQRRIQCSIPNRVFWRAVGRELQKTDAPTLWGTGFLNPVISSARSFK